MQDTIEGYVEHIIFRNEENGYTVFNLMTDGSPLTCTGILQGGYRGREPCSERSLYGTLSVRAAVQGGGI